MIKSVSVSAAVLALITLCGCHAQGSYSSGPLSAWQEVAAPKEGSAALQKAGDSLQEWEVTRTHGKPSAYLVDGGECHIRLPFPIPFDPLRRGARFAVRVADGWLVGFNAGEWGGSVWWYSPNGRRCYKVSNDQIVGFVQTPMGLLAAEGLAGYSSNGKIVRLTQNAQGRWQSAGFASLGDAPDAAALDADGSLVVVTSRKLVRVLPTGEVKVLLQNSVLQELGPSSMLRNGPGDFFVGMRGYVMRVKTSAAGTRLEWLQPPKQ